MKLAPSVQRKVLDLTPVPVLEFLCRAHPRLAIELLCYWISEKNPDIEERMFASRKSTALVPVVKKFSQLSVVSILNLLRQDESLWRLYVAGVGIIPFKSLPYILLELMFDLGGNEGKQKVIGLVQSARQTVGGRRLGEILENFKTDTVLDILEELPEFDTRMRLMFNKPKTVAFWLDHWDMRMKNLGLPAKSIYWLGKLPGEQAYEIEYLMKLLEFRRKVDPTESIYDEKHDWDHIGKSLDK